MRIYKKLGDGKKVEKKIIPPFLFLCWLQGECRSVYYLWKYFTKLEIDKILQKLMNFIFIQKLKKINEVI